MTTFIIQLLVASYLLVATTANVYVCNGSYSKKYHLIENCSGLRNCSTLIEKVSLKYATEELKRTKCAISTCK